jgi:hypothetical protein
MPKACLAMPQHVARPGLLPLPDSFVVKNGSKMRFNTSLLMQKPLSVMSRQTNSPAQPVARCVASALPTVVMPSLIVTRPPPGIASRAR